MFSKPRLKSPCFPRITKKTIQPLWVQLKTFAGMVINCAAAVTNALAPHIAISPTAIGNFVDIYVTSVVTFVISCMAVDMLFGRVKMVGIGLKILMFFIVLCIPCKIDST